MKAQDFKNTLIICIMKALLFLKIRYLFLILLLLISNLNTKSQNSSIVLDGINNYLSLGNVNLALTNKLTIMAWVKWDIDPKKGNNWANIFSNTSNLRNDYGVFWIQHNSNNTKFEFALNTTTGRRFIYSSTTPEQDVWYHIAAVYDGEKMYLYINGLLENDVNKTGNIVAHEAQFFTNIGSIAFDNNNFRRFKGEINDLSIFNKALTEEEINNLKCEINLNDFSLLAFWSFDSINNNIVSDYTKNNYDLTNYGGIINISNNSPCSTLPINLINYTLKCTATGSILHWATASEINNNYFSVEKSTDMKDWKLITTISGEMNSFIEKRYELKDDESQEQTTYYKLSQTDYDGTVVQLDVLSILCSFENNLLDIIGINVSENNINLIVKTEGFSDITSEIYDISGKLIVSKTQKPVKGANIIQLETLGISAGMYIAVVIQDGKKVAKKINIG